MKFDCAFCNTEGDDSDRPILKVCRKSNYIVAYFTFCNTECEDNFTKELYQIRKRNVKKSEVSKYKEITKPNKNRNHKIKTDNNQTTFMDY